MASSVRGFGRRIFPRGIVSIALLLSTLHIGLWECSTVQAQTVLNDGQWYEAKKINNDEWRHYRIFVFDWQSDMKVTMVANHGNPDVYVRFNSTPTLSNFDFRPYLSSTEIVNVSNATTIPLQTGWYYISVHGRVIPKAELSGHSFSLKVERSTTASRQNGMGALPFSTVATTGSGFRVWAPFANSVHVAGQFNGWSSTNAPLVNEGNGYWSIDHRNANPGHQYKYVIRNGNQVIWRNDPCEEQVVNSVGNSIIFEDQFNWTDGAFEMPTWDNLVCYEMHLGTFNDQPGGGPGTCNSSIERLDYLRDLGVNCIKLMPVNEFPGDFSWGYNPSAPYAVETAYGGSRELKRFVNEAHSRGIAVLLDLVHNHWGPTDLDTWRFDGWWQGNYGGIYFYQDERSVTPWGDTRPDFGRSEVRQYIRDNVLMWLHDFHIDGIRFDSTLNVRTTNLGFNPEGWGLLRWINDEVDGRQPWKIMIAEDLQGDGAITRPTSQGGAGFDSQWDAGFVHPIRATLEAANDADRNMFSVRDSILNNYNNSPLQRVIYTESHDEVANGRTRVPEAIWPGNAASWHSQKRSTLGAALVMTSPGIPMIFQGQEILEDGWFRDDDPVDWNKEIIHAGIKLMYTDMIKLRRNWHNHTAGLRGNSTNVFHVNNDQKMIAFHRWAQGGPGDDVIVVANFSNATRTNYRIGLPRTGLWRVRFNSDWNGYSSAFGNQFTGDLSAQGVAWDGLGFSGTLDIAPYSVVILSQ